MISYWHIPALVICFFIIMFIGHKWVWIYRLGLTRTVIRFAPWLISRDSIALASATAAFLIAMETPASPGITVFMSLACTGISMLSVHTSELDIKIKRGQS